MHIWTVLDPQSVAHLPLIWHSLLICSSLKHQHVVWLCYNLGRYIGLFERDTYISISKRCLGEGWSPILVHLWPNLGNTTTLGPYMSMTNFESSHHQPLGIKSYWVNIPKTPCWLEIQLPKSVTIESETWVNCAFIHMNYCRLFVHCKIWWGGGLKIWQC